jgi:hypothetical protein
MRNLISTCLLCAVAISLQATAQVTLVTDAYSVPHGDYITAPGVPDCGDGRSSTDYLAAAADVLAGLEAAGPVGALSSALEYAVRENNGQIGGAVGEILQGIYGDHQATCVVLVVAIPGSARIKGVYIDAWDAYTPGVCQLGTECSMSSCKFGSVCAVGWSQFDPWVETQAGPYRLVSSVFRNWSHDRGRTARMSVAY